MGDKHWGGKSVSIIEFNDGKKIVYKPRSLQIDLFFNKLLYFLVEKNEIGFKWFKIINKGNYGWCEFVSYTECKTTQEIEEYYYRLGFLLCILYVLEATDFHYENIIAMGGHPMLIDLESFFHPYIPIEGTETNQGMDKSVLRTGILPLTFMRNRENNDISGLSDVSNVKSYLNNIEVISNEKGEPFIERKKDFLSEGKNLPTFKGKKHNISSYRSFFKKGFKSCYNIILSNKEKIINEIDNIKECQVRVLFRDTVVYSHLLNEAYHPTLLKEKENVFEHFSWLKEVIPDYKIIEKLVKYEIEDLQNMDIPLFVSEVNSRHLWYGQDKIIENFFEKTGKETVNDKINSLSIDDLNLQLWYINKSIDIVDFINSYDNKDLSTTNNIGSHNKQDIKDDIINQVLTIYEYIAKNIYISKNNISWLVHKPTTLDGDIFSIYPSSYDLYSGMPGEILLFYLVEKLLVYNPSTHLKIHINPSKN